MSPINIHWRGYPYYRCPRIRFASSNSSSSGRVISRPTAKRSLKSTSTAAFEHARRRQRTKARRRGRRISRASVSGASTRRIRSSLRTISSAGRPTSTARHSPPAPHIPFSAPVTKHRASGKFGQRSESFGLEASPSAAVHSINTQGTIKSNGVYRASSKRRRPHGQYSLMHVPDQQSTALSTPSILSRSGNVIPAKPADEYAHVGPFDTVSRRHKPAGVQLLDISRNYDSRLPYRKAQPQTMPKTPFDRANAEPIVLRKEQQKQNIGNVNGSSNHVHNTFSGNSPSSSKESQEAFFFYTPSRTVSEERALKKFTKRLEHFVEERPSMPRRCPSRATSVTDITTDTIQALKPYHGEFKSAGLAITSAEQQRRLPITQKPLPALPASIEEFKVNENHAAIQPATPEEIGKRSFRSIVDLDYDSPKLSSQLKQRSPRKLNPRKEREPALAAVELERISHILDDDDPRDFEPSDQETEKQPMSTSKPIAESPGPSGAVPRSPFAWLRRPNAEPHATSQTDTDIQVKAAFSKPGVKLPPKERATSVSQPASRRSPSTSMPPSSRPIVPFGSRIKELTKPVSSLQPRRTFSLSKIGGIPSRSRLADRHVPASRTPAKPMVPTGESPTQNGKGKADMSEGIPTGSPHVKKYGVETILARIGEKGGKPLVTNTDLETRGNNRLSPSKLPVSVSNPSDAIKSSDSPRSVSKPTSRYNLAQLPVTPMTPADTHLSPAAAVRSIAEVKPSTPRKSPVSELNIQLEANAHPYPTIKQVSPHISSHPSLVRHQHGEELPSKSAGPGSPSPERVDTPRANDSIRNVQSVQTASTRDHTAPPPMPDPMKKPLPPSPFFNAQKNPKSISESKQPKAPKDSSHPPLPSPLDTSAASTTTNMTSSSSTLTPSRAQRQVFQRKVFKGLQVASAAACDEDVDMWILEVTGLGVREFLAKLSKFEDVGVNALQDVARRAEEMRRREIRGLEDTRRRRVRRRERALGIDKGKEKEAGVQ